MEIEKLLQSQGENKAYILNEIMKCKNVEELLTLSIERNLAMNKEEAEKILQELTQKNRALSDDELDNVAGGEGELISLRGTSECPGPNNCCREKCIKCMYCFQILTEPEPLVACFGF
ncbi:MAG: hypothetical protein ACERKN_16120 [Velocimicrobium sp.]